MTHYSLILTLTAPLQSWGSSSRYTRRLTEGVPTRSAIIGMIASAQGRDRTDDISDLSRLVVAVRVDQPGVPMTDYHTVEVSPGRTKITHRDYLQDGRFVVAVQSDDPAQLESIRYCLENPTFSTFLGRRSCPTPPDMVRGIVPLSAVDALHDHATWHALESHGRSCPPSVSLPIYRECAPGESSGAQLRDVPISFHQDERQFGWRQVIIDSYATMKNPWCTSCPDSDPHDPWAALFA